MKKTILTAGIVFAALVSNAQSLPAKSTAADAAYSDALNKIVFDFPSNFTHIQGSKMPADIDADAYTSKICIPAALGCKVMHYHSEQDKSASWQAGLYEGESFEDALKVYKKTFAQIKKTTVKGIDPANTAFEGKMENIDESVGFATSTLRLKTKNKTYKPLVAEVEMLSNYTGWEVRLNIYTKKLMEEEKEDSGK